MSSSDISTVRPWYNAAAPRVRPSLQLRAFAAHNADRAGQLDPARSGPVPAGLRRAATHEGTF